MLGVSTFCKALVTINLSATSWSWVLWMNVIIPHIKPKASNISINGGKWATVLNMKNLINWFEIYVSDMQRATNFYTTVFQCEFKDVPMDNERHPEMEYAFFGADPKENGAAGALVKMDAVQPGAGSTLVYFATDEINAELSRVEAAGGKILRPKLQVPVGGFIALVQDTEGNMIGLSSRA